MSFEQNSTWGLDLVDYSAEQGSNKGYILVCIDYFSRYAYARIISNKSKKSIHDAFIDICINDSKFYPDFIHSDRESGLIHNKDLPHTQIYHTDNLASKEGSPIVERFIRTLREKLEQKRAETPGRQWKQHVSKAIQEYNTTKHRTLKMSPAEASTDDKKDEVLELQRGRHLENQQKGEVKLSVGDKVLALKDTKTFEKGFKQKWNRAILTVTAIDDGSPVTYTCDDGKKYYYQQLNKISSKQISYLNKKDKKKAIQEV